MYCGNYTGYYTKGVRHFDSAKQGYCSQCKKIVKYCDNCEYWKTGGRRFYVRKKAVIRALYELLTNISAIRQILQESQDEGKNL